MAALSHVYSAAIAFVFMRFSFAAERLAFNGLNPTNIYRNYVLPTNIENQIEDSGSNPLVGSRTGAVLLPNPFPAPATSNRT
jgi:hypothetical protein